MGATLKSIVRISGGVGNQFFQLAFGDFLKNTLKHEILFDTSFYDCQKSSLSNTKRDFVGNVLDPLAVYRNCDLFTIESKFQSLINSGKNKIYLKALRFFLLVRILISHRFIFHFKPEISNLWSFLGNSVTHVFIGSWQKVSYVREEFRNLVFNNLQGKVKVEIPHPLSKYLGLHVRRGDYLNSNSIHNVLEESYYHHAISILEKDVFRPILLIFTDDTQWCKNNIRLHFPIVFANEIADSDLGELALMSQLDYLVMGNSSFSFTAALLGKSNKKVIAPLNWFSSHPHQHLLDIPITWIRI